MPAPPLGSEPAITRTVLVKLLINDYGFISKSFPEYWTILQKLNFDLEFDN